MFSLFKEWSPGPFQLAKSPGMDTTLFRDGSRRHSLLDLAGKAPSRCEQHSQQVGTGSQSPHSITGVEGGDFCTG